MRNPIRFVHGNLVFTGSGEREDVWAFYRVDGVSYPGRSVAAKLELKDRLESFAYRVEADFQIIRISRSWSPDEYVQRALSTLDSRHGHRGLFQAHLDAHLDAFERREVMRTEIYLGVRLEQRPERGGDLLSNVLGRGNLAALGRRLGEAVGLRDPRGLTAASIASLRKAEHRVFERLFNSLECDRARSSDIAYLVRHAYARGVGRGIGREVGEPAGEETFRPQAIALVDETGEERFEPYEHDLLRLHASRVTIEPRSLRIDSELGESHQALLAVGALPEETLFPGAEAELLFAPLDVDFPVDATLHAEWIPNRQALGIARKRKIDADRIAEEEAHGDHGPSADSAERPYEARQLEQRLTGSDRAPLLRATMILAVGAPAIDSLTERVDRLRTEFGSTQLHHPLGDQHRLFISMLPAQASYALNDYREMLLPEQFAAMVPNAVSGAGSEIGPCIGHTVSASRQPVQLDLAEPCQGSRPPTMLLTGTLGSGKTIAMELLLWQAFMQGSLIVDLDPKGDHHLERLPGVVGHIEQVVLSADEAYRGLLDPMRIAEPEIKEDLAYGFLTTILPQPLPPEWQTELRLAVSACAPTAQSCYAVLEELRAGNEPARALARSLEIHSDAGLAKLGFARPGTEAPKIGDAQIVSLQIRNLATPLPGTARSEYLEEERVSQAILRLLATYALRLCAGDRTRHAALGIDEAWALLADSQGRALIDRMSRMGRAMNITPILASQKVADAEDLDGLIGAVMAFGVETTSEAAKALRLLQLDEDDPTQLHQLTTFRQGRALFRDYEGNTAPIQIDPPEDILKALDTTPTREPASQTTAVAPP